MLTPKKMKIIIASVSTVSVGAGAAGLIYGLTKQPEKVITTGYTLHIKYLNDPKANTDITTYEHMLTVSETTIKTIASLPFDDPKDKDHHTKALDKIYADTSQKVTIYDPDEEYNEVTLSGDTTWYVALEQSHYHVFLHYWNSDQVYNPNDWYPTEKYDPTTVGFTQRGAPTEVTNYEFLGWQLNTEDKATAKTKDECLYGVGESYREDNNGNAWPVVPDKMKIDHQKAGPKTWHLHPIYKLVQTTFNFFDDNGSDKIMDSITTPSKDPEREIGTPSKEHHDFDHWTYMDETKLITEDGEKTRGKDSVVEEGDLQCEFLCPTVRLKAHWKQDQHKAIFYLNNTYTKFEEVWVDIVDDPTSRAEINEADLPITTPITTQKNYKFVGWSEKENPTTREDIVPFWPVSFDNDEKKFYPVFIEADFTITVNYEYDGIKGVWKKDGDEDVPTTGTSSFGVWKDTSYTVLDLTNEARMSLNLDDGYQLYGDGVKPNFLGWKLTDHSELIQTTIKFTESTIINAVYGDSNNITVTFNSNGGDFTYKDKYNETITNSIISYNLNLATWRTEHEGHVYLHDVYEAATQAISSQRSEIVLSRDGWNFDTSTYSEDDPSTKSGWTSYGINLAHNFEINEALAVEAKWVEKTAVSWKNDDWGTIARYADLGYEEFKKAYSEAYASTNNEGLTSEGAPANKAKNTFVGLQKEISIPTLGDETYTVRVIGVKQDNIASSTNKVALTFDFIDCPISAAVGKTNNYVTGYINKTYAGLIKGGMTYTMRNSIKPVVKSQIIDNSTESSTNAYSTTTFSNYVFIESAYEVNGGTVRTTGGSSTEIKDSSAYVEYADPHSVSTEEYDANLIQYDWYTKAYEDPTKDAEKTGAGSDVLVSREQCDSGHGERVFTDTPDCSYRCKYLNNTTEITPWQLRTPGIRGYYNPEQTTNMQGNSFYVTADESYNVKEQRATGKPAYGGIWDYYSNIANCISPCFCLGLATV